MNKLVFSFLVLSFAFTLCSLFQKTNEQEDMISVQGSVQDSVYHVPIPALVSVSYKDKLIAETQSNDSGLFILTLPKKYLNKEVVCEVQPTMTNYFEKKNAYGNKSVYVICKDKERFRLILLEENQILLKLCIAIEQGNISH